MIEKTCSVGLRDGVAVMTLKEIIECGERKRKEYAKVLQEIGMYTMFIEERKKEASYLRKEVLNLSQAKVALEHLEQREKNEII